LHGYINTNRARQKAWRDGKTVENGINAWEQLSLSHFFILPLNFNLSIYRDLLLRILVAFLFFFLVPIRLTFFHSFLSLFFGVFLAMVGLSCILSPAEIE
jgi:hypothetical protein